MKIAFLLSLACAAAAPTAFAAKGLGAQGTIVPSGEISFVHSQFEGPPTYGPSTYTRFGAQPNIRYFLVESWSLGLGVLAAASFWGETRSTELGLRGGTGYFFDLSGDVGFFPEVALSVSRHLSTYKYSDDESSSVSLIIEVTAPLLYHAHHFFVGAGPQYLKYVPVSSEHNGMETGGTYGSSSIGITTVFGGWF
jgi:hypothetical protein